MKLKTFEKYSFWCVENFKKNRDAYIKETQEKLNLKNIGIIQRFCEFEKDKFIEENIIK